MRITEMTPGDRARLVGFGDTPLAYKRRLMSLGMTSGVELTLVRLAPLGCPMQIDLRGTSLSVRKDEANQLILERL